MQLLLGKGRPFFDVHPALPLPTTALPMLQGALKDGFGEAVVACDMADPCEASVIHTRRQAGHNELLYLQVRTAVATSSASATRTASAVRDWMTATPCTSNRSSPVLPSTR